MEKLSLSILLEFEHFLQYRQQNLSKEWDWENGTSELCFFVVCGLTLTGHVSNLNKKRKLESILDLSDVKNCLHILKC